MSLRLGRLIAALVVMLAAAGCGSHSTTSSNSSGAGTVASSPASAPVTLSETGSTLLYTLFDLWASVYHAKYPNVSINTQATGSANGIAQAAAGAVTIGGSDAYLSEADMSAHKSVMNIAVAVSAQEVNYNLPGVKDNLQLNGPVLAAMYRGSVKAWNDPQIAALNPGVNIPDTPVVPLHRSDGSGNTFLFTQYLSKQDPNGWDVPGFGIAVDFPAAPGALAEKGNGGMVTGCAKTPGCVAYVGVSFLNQAEQSGLGEAATGQQIREIHAAYCEEHRGRRRRSRRTDAVQRSDLADRRARRGWLPDRQLRVRRRRQSPKGSVDRADSAGVSALGGSPTVARRRIGQGALPAAAGRGGMKLSDAESPRSRVSDGDRLGGTKLALLSRERGSTGPSGRMRPKQDAVKSARPELSPASGKLARSGQLKWDVDILFESY